MITGVVGDEDMMVGVMKAESCGNGGQDVRSGSIAEHIYHSDQL